MPEDEEQELKVIDHLLVPKHEILNEKEVKQVSVQYNSTPDQFPYIQISDPALRELEPKVGNLVKITRQSQTAGETIYYRFVVEA